MNNELVALESAIATLEMLFQSIEFSNEEDARRVSIRLYRTAKRLFALAEQSSPEDHYR